MVERVRTVTVEVPVVQKLPDDLTRDCVPGFVYPAVMTVDALIDRLVALETANATCRDQLARIRRTAQK